MSSNDDFLFLLAPALLVTFQLIRCLGWWRGACLGLAGLLLVVGGWGLLRWQHQRDSMERVPPEQVASVVSTTCAKCHADHYRSWHRSYHRTMTREATPANVKGDFNNATHQYGNVTSRMTRIRDRFFMETVDPAWAARAARAGLPPVAWRTAPRKEFSVDRLVGSHWFQECLHRDEEGRYWRLPLSYHLVEQRWIHTNGAFLAPDTDDFYAKSTLWNESCVYCHNTRPSKNPRSVPGEPLKGYRTEVVELGISCEACHGPGERHTRLNQNPAGRLAVRQCVRDGGADSSIVNPRRLSPKRRGDEICARCHAGTVPQPQAWNLRTMADPFHPGQELARSHLVFWSETEQALLYKGEKPDPPPPPAPLDGRFWGNGTPLTTALEYQGMALSACYQGGNGNLRCLSCHSMHLYSDPNFQLARGMETNEACYQCHADYRTRLTEHTHHPAGSPGSLCYNCHMPYQVYSLLNTHRSHRIASPRVRDSLGTGKPHACNLCHLDKSLGWTQEWLGRWYSQAPVNLPEQEKRYASSLLHLWQGDARSRVVVAGAFSSPVAQAALQASGRDWPVSVLMVALGRERYPAVRYLAHRGLRTLLGAGALGYNYQGSPEERAAQLARLAGRLPEQALPAARYPHLPLTRHPAASGLRRLDEAAVERLLRQRKDPDVFINE
jgi:predicted CXXCH cytochrome family protein